MNTEVMFSSQTDNWRTPETLYAGLNEEFDFDDDPCPIGATDGLIRPWGKRVFVNPPYSNVTGFLKKAILEMQAGRSDVVVFLVPSRTDTKWWHDLMMPYAKEIRFIKGRLRFGGAKNSAPFPSVICILRDEVTDRNDK